LLILELAGWQSWLFLAGRQVAGWLAELAGWLARMLTVIRVQTRVSPQTPL